MSIDQAAFRHVLGHFVSGVTVVTACHDGYCHGITVSSFTSLSLDPPLILVCIDRRVSSHDLIRNAGSFAVNILADDSEDLSRHFATRDADKFATVAYHMGEAGAPLLDRALATIECRVHDVLPGGDHSIIVGEVLALNAHDDRDPLVYFRSGYRRIR